MKNILAIGLALLAASCTSAPHKSREITVKVAAPGGEWGIFIEEVYQAKEELLVISRFRQVRDSGPPAIVRISDTVTVEAPDFPVKHYCIGKTWHWENSEPYVFLADRNQIQNKLKSGTLIWKKEER